MAADMAHELQSYQVSVIALCPGMVATEMIMARRKNKALEQWMETPLFVGRAVVALTTDPQIMKKTGSLCQTRALAQEYGFTDVDGHQPEMGRSAVSSLERAPPNTAGTDYCSCQVREKTPVIPCESGSKQKSAVETLLLRQIFWLPETIIFFFGNVSPWRHATLRHPRQPLHRDGVQNFSFVDSNNCYALKPSSVHPCQDFVSWRQPPRNILAHKPRDVSFNTQLHRGIFGELLVGQSLADVFA